MNNDYSNFREELESKLLECTKEINFLYNNMITEKQNKTYIFSKSLFLLLYAHYEGFCNMLLKSYIQEINLQGLKRREVIEALKDIRYIYSQVNWLQSKFVNGKFEDIKGLCKVVDINEVEANDWSLMPGRYVGVAQVIDEDFDFEGRLKEIQMELDGLNDEAFELAKVIKMNFEELGI